MDIWDKEKRSAVMAKIRGKDTKPEWIVRRYLFAHGYRYRKNVKSLPGTPDIVLRKYGLVIFVHGCFWHGHGDSHIPHSRIEYWTKKSKPTRSGINGTRPNCSAWAGTCSRYGNASSNLPSGNRR